MNGSDALFQAEKLRSFVRRGGDARAWFFSKDFPRRDRAQIEAAHARLLREEVARECVRVRS